MKINEIKEIYKQNKIGFFISIFLIILVGTIILGRHKELNSLSFALLFPYSFFSTSILFITFSKFLYWNSK